MKTKIKTIEAKFWQSKPNGFKVVLEDGTEGNLSEKDSDKDLKNGDEVEVTISDYISKTGKHSNLFAIKRSVSETPQKEFKTETKSPIETVIPLSTRLERPNTKSFIEMKHELRRDLIETLGRIAAAGRIEPKEMVDYYNEYYPAIDLSIDVLSK
jgi:hypothetical protein